MDFLTAGLLLVVLPGLYIYTASVVQARLPTLRNKRICLLIAHPDDEAMFFAPTVLALTRPETGNHVKILCLSSGNAAGLGETRKRELVESGMILGLRRPDDVFVVDNPVDFPDSMTTPWDPAQISNLLSSAFAPQLGSPRSPSDPPSATIDVLVTFDSQGVSSHPNHVSLYHGARAFVAALVRGKPGWNSPVDLYALRTVSIARKYTGVLDAAATLAGWAFSTDMRRDRRRPAGLVFMNGLGLGTLGGPQLGTAWKAMTRAHKSQMVWFRYGWIVLSRYMLMNDLRLERVKAA